MSHTKNVREEHKLSLLCDSCYPVVRSSCLIENTLRFQVYICASIHFRTLSAQQRDNSIQLLQYFITLVEERERERDK